MSMPGFTADATIYRASANYRGAASTEGVGRVVIPQARNCKDLLDELMEYCGRVGWYSGECRGALLVYGNSGC